MKIKSIFTDSILFLKTFTLPRILNTIKLYVSYVFSRLFRKSLLWGKPVAFSIEPTTHCNLHCLECPSGQRKFSRPTGTASLEIFYHIIDQIHPFCNYLTLYFQGEPYLNIHFFDFVCYARSKKIYVSTSTNAHFLTPENSWATVKSGLNRLILSLDGIDQQSYERYRKGGNFCQVIEGIRNLVHAKEKSGSKTPFIILQFIVFKHNQHQIKQVKQLASQLGVDKLELKSPQIYRENEIEYLQSDIPHFQRYIRKSDKCWTTRKPLRNRCWRMWSSCVITWNGEIVPCCFDKDAELKMGNITATCFFDIWKSEKYQSFRNQLFTDRKKIKICCNCTK